MLLFTYRYSSGGIRMYHFISRHSHVLEWIQGIKNVSFSSSILSFKSHIVAYNQNSDVTVCFFLFTLMKICPSVSFAKQWNLDLTNLCIMKSRYNKRVIVKHMEKNHQYNDICHCELIWLAPWTFVIIIGVPLYYVKLFIFFLVQKLIKYRKL